MSARHALFYNEIMKKSVLLALVFVGFGIVVAGRLWRTPDLWLNWLALGLVVGGLGLCWLVWRRAGTEAKARWYSLRPGILALGLIPFLLLWFAWRVPAAMGEGPAGPAVPEALFASAWSEREVLLLSLGDSVSTGYGAPRGHGYFDLIRDNVAATYPEMEGRELGAVLPNLNVSRRASNSSNSLAHRSVIEHLPAQDEGVFGIVCITTGGIDLIHHYGKREPVEGAMYGASWQQAKPWIENFRERLDAMMLALKSKFPGGCAVMLATIYEPTDNVGDIENAGPMFWLPAWENGRPIHGAFNLAIRDCAARHDHVHLVDVYEVMLGHGIHCRDRTNPHYDADDPTYWFYANLEDPNRRGYDAIRRVFLNAIIVALRGEPGFDVPPVMSQTSHHGRSPEFSTQGLCRDRGRAGRFSGCVRGAAGVVLAAYAAAQRRGHQQNGADH